MEGNVQCLNPHEGVGSREKGQSFDDSHRYQAYGRISQLTVRHTEDKIIALGITFENGKHFLHGGSGGTFEVIDLERDEDIREVILMGDTDEIKMIGFAASKRSFGPFGELKEKSNYTMMTFEIPENENVLYFFGRSSNDKLIQIGIAKGTSPKSLGIDGVVRVGPVGKDNGTLFDDLDKTVGNKIKKILVKTSGQRVKAIWLQYDSHEDWIKHGEGENDDTDHKFEIEEDEYLVKIAGEYMDSSESFARIQFILNSGRHSPVFGNRKGNEFILEKKNHTVKALFGRVGDNSMGVRGGLLIKKVPTQLGAFFETVTPIKIRILSMKFDVENKEITIDEEKPLGRTEVTLENNSTSEQSTSWSPTISWTQHGSTSVTETEGRAVDVTYSQEFGVGFHNINSTTGISVNVNKSMEHSETTEEGWEVTKEQVFTFNVSASPKKKVTARCVIVGGEYKIPWKADAEVFYTFSSKPKKKKISGIWKGVQMAQVKAWFEDVDVV